MVHSSRNTRNFFSKICHPTLWGHELKSKVRLETFFKNIWCQPANHQIYQMFHAFAVREEEGFS